MFGSNSGHNTSYRDWTSSWLSSVSPGKYWDSTSVRSKYFLPNSFSYNKTLYNPASDSVVNQRTERRLSNGAAVAPPTTNVIQFCTKGKYRLDGSQNADIHNESVVIRAIFPPLSPEVNLPNTLLTTGLCTHNEIHGSVLGREENVVTSTWGRLICADQDQWWHFQRCYTIMGWRTGRRINWWMLVVVTYLSITRQNGVGGRKRFFLTGRAQGRSGPYPPQTTLTLAFKWSHTLMFPTHTVHVFNVSPRQISWQHNTDELNCEISR